MSSTKQVKLFLRRDDIFSIPFEVDTPCGRKFEIEERLDRGGNGAVHRCVEATTGNEYAIKFLLKYDRSNKRLRRFNYERDQLKQLKHEHLIRFIAGGSISSKRTFNRTKSTKNVEFFIMDLADSGNLQGLSLQAKKYTRRNLQSTVSRPSLRSSVSTSKRCCPSRH
jgi:serine/threonine protein kinase